MIYENGIDRIMVGRGENQPPYGIKIVYSLKYFYCCWMIWFDDDYVARTLRQKSISFWLRLGLAVLSLLSIVKGFYPKSRFTTRQRGWSYVGRLGCWMIVRHKFHGRRTGELLEINPCLFLFLMCVSIDLVLVWNHKTNPLSKISSIPRCKDCAAPLVHHHHHHSTVIYRIRIFQ